jgi:hypothetical protein
MQNVFADTVMFAQIINGVVRFRLGTLRPAAGNDAKAIQPEAAAEIFLPISGFTDLANTCNKVAADLLEKGLLNRGDAAEQKSVKSDS